MNYSIDKINIAKEDFDNEIVMINIPLGKYYSVRGKAGLYLMEQLEQAVGLEELQKRALMSFDGNEREIRESVISFFESLEREKIIVKNVTSNTVVESLETIKKESFTEPVLEVYDDMQELIELDPVHDVESSLGWPKKKDEK